MDLDLTAEQRAFRDEVRAWLAANVPAQPLPAAQTDEGFAAHREWERRLYAAGYAASSWPTEHGGRDADLLTQALFAEEYARARAPDRINVLGLGLAGPTLIAYGTDEQRRRWLPGILSCDDIWSQGFSEPEAGSDLAGIATSAVRDGDDYVVNGQKTWTSLGRYADWMFALVRTDREAPRHRGLSFVMIDLRSDGVEVRPLTQLNGDAGFAEVFLTDVRVPVANRVGDEHGGWYVAMGTLGFERGTGLGNHVRFSQEVQDLVDLAREQGRADDPLVRDELARLYTETEVFRHHMHRQLTRLAAGTPPGAESSITKLYWSEMHTRILDARMRLLGARAEAAADTWRRYWYARAGTIYAGTSEVQKNIVAQRVLGLPRDGSGT